MSLKRVRIFLNSKSNKTNLQNVCDDFRSNDDVHAIYDWEVFLPSKVK